MLKLLVLLISIIVARGLFICQDGTPIARSKLCDGKVDCEDGTDESTTLCARIICPRNKFRCQYGGCIDRRGRCNGTVECADGSDEHYCKSEYKCSESQFECLLEGNCIDESLICNGVSDCSNGSDENEELCKSASCPTNMFRCRHGGCIYDDRICDEHLDCPDGSDESNTFCDNLRCKVKNNCTNHLSCKPIQDTKLDATCRLGMIRDTDCNKSIPIGTTAHLRCPEYYTSTSNYGVELQCQLNGRWNGNILKCVPECGKLDPDVIPLIVDGRNISNWPWHAVMYLLKSKKWSSACGGTLISERVVLTAAHCTWKKAINHLKFAFGKYYSDFDKTEAFTQIRDVHKILTPAEYLDYQSNYGSDISAVVLSKPVQLTKYVKPACLDWNLSNMDQHLSANNIGTIAGVGLTANDHSSQRLQAVNVPVISPSSCIRNQKRDFRKYITHTTFCAGWANGTGVCNGDSGGGLLFKDIRDPDRWVLQGLVSVSPRRTGNNLCDTTRYTVFTKITLYLNWLRHTISTEL